MKLKSTSPKPHVLFIVLRKTTSILLIMDYIIGSGPYEIRVDFLTLVKSCKRRISFSTGSLFKINFSWRVLGNGFLYWKDSFADPVSKRKLLKFPSNPNHQLKSLETVNRFISDVYPLLLRSLWLTEPLSALATGFSG